jgi:hypothetical protein
MRGPELLYPREPIMSENNQNNRSKNRTLTIFLVILAVFGAGVAAVATGSLQKMPFFDTLLGVPKEELDKKLNSLKLGVNIEQFHTLLGKPVISENKSIKLISYSLKWHGTPKKEVREVPYTEYFYNHPHYYVQAITNESGKVDFYSITAKTAKYHPQLTTALGNSVQLGKSVYGDLQKIPFKIGGRLSENAKNTAYYEVFSLTSQEQKWAVFSSNPYGYLTTLVPLDEKKEGFLVKRFREGDSFPLNPIHETFRKSTIINTYSAATPEFLGIDTAPDGLNYGEGKISFGPREEQLGALK